MYNTFFGLAESPFNITPDSRFLYPSQLHREAYGALHFGIKERKGFILMTGEIGSGKTTLCRKLVSDLRAENVRIALILNPGLTEIELLKAINDEFQIPSYYNTKKGLIDELNRYLIDEHSKGNNVTLIIDEAQTLQPDLLEQIRMLSNLETESDKLIQIVLMGQPELNETLRLPSLEQLNQRITVRYHLKPLNQDEMAEYIRHRLNVAQAKVDVTFSDAAIKALYQATGGVPRRINVVCDHVLLACYTEGTYEVNDRIVQKCVTDVFGEQLVPGAAHGGTRRMATIAAEKVVTVATKKSTVMALLGLIAAVVVLAAAIAGGIWLANTRLGNPDNQDVALAMPKFSPKPAATPEPEPAASDTETTKTESGNAAANPTPTPRAPTPTPDYDLLRKRNPNWMYEKNAPLVRVNNPRTVLRAAQLSMLKMWGIVVDLSDMAKLGDELVLNGEWKTESLGIFEVDVPGDYDSALRLGVPLIVRLRNPEADQSEYVVLLRAEGEAVTIGDPQWGIKTYRTTEFAKKWSSATAVYRDIYKLKQLQKGDQSQTVRALQEFLREQKYLSDVSGVFDSKTTEAIEKFQRYYSLKETGGNLGDLTALLLNSRMSREGPRLNGADSGSGRLTAVPGQ